MERAIAVRGMTISDMIGALFFGQPIITPIVPAANSTTGPTDQITGASALLASIAAVVSDGGLLKSFRSPVMRSSAPMMIPAAAQPAGPNMLPVISSDKPLPSPKADIPTFIIPDHEKPLAHID